jgi:hypothetical protein
MNWEAIAIASAIVGVTALFVLLGVALYRKRRSVGEPHGRAAAFAVRQVMLFFLLHGVSLLVLGLAFWLVAPVLVAEGSGDATAMARIFLVGGAAFALVSGVVILITRRWLRPSPQG